MLGSSDMLSWIPVNLHAGKGPSIVLMQSEPDGRTSLVEIPPGEGRYPFISVTFTGQEDSGQSMRSNASGIGTQFAARRGANWSTGRVLRDDSGQESLQPVAIGLDPTPESISWRSNGQMASIGLNLVCPRMPSSRRPSGSSRSCPVLFMHDGQDFVFIGDVLGVGGIGFRTGRDTVVSPRPWERFLIRKSTPLRTIRVHSRRTDGGVLLPRLLSLSSGSFPRLVDDIG